MRAAAAALLLLLAAAAAFAEGREDYFHATDLEAAGRFEEAARVYQSIADTQPQDRFADDALAALAKLREEKLNDPVGALAAYERLLRDYPSSNLGIRAKTRAELLRRGMGPDQASAQALAEYNDILNRFVSRPRTESVARMEKLVAEHPDFPLAPEATFWIGSMQQQQGHPDAALARFREVIQRWPHSQVEPRARKAVGDVLLAAGDYEGAARSYRTLEGRGDPALDAVAREALGKLGIERWRARLYTVSWVLVALFPLLMLLLARRVTGAWRATARALERPPVEFFYLLPVALLFVGAAMTEHSALGHAVETIAGGSLVVTWLSGAALEAARARDGGVSPLRALAHIAATAATVLAICYIAVTRERLVDMLIETFRYGAERE